MSSLVVCAVLVAAVFHATWNALVKGRGGTDPLVSTFGLCMAWVFIAGPATLLVEPLPVEAVPYLAASVVVHLLYTTLLVMAYRSGALSVVYPIARGTPPLLVALAAALMGELLSPLHGLGVGVLTLGVLVLSPARGGPVAPRAVWLALACATCTATYTLVDGTGTRLADSPLSYIVWLTAAQGGLFVLGALAVRGTSLLVALRSRIPTALGAGILSASGYGVALWAMTEAPIAAVAALRESSVPIAAMLGVWWLGERLDGRRSAAIVLVAIGAALLRLG